MKKIITILLLALPILAAAQIQKGTGIIYYDSIPNSAAFTPSGSEFAFGIKTKSLYQWDRDSSEWVNIRDTIYQVTTLADTTTITPRQGDWMINSTADTLGNYTGQSWAIFVVGGGGSGETNTASNLGTSVGDTIFYQKVGADLQFKSLVPGSSISFLPTDSTITINVVGGSESGLSEYFEYIITDTDPDTIAVTSGTPAISDGGAINQSSSAFSLIGTSGRILYSGAATVFVLLDVSTSFSFSVGNQVIEAWVYKNGVALENTEMHRKIGTSGDIGNGGLVGLTSISNGDTLDLRYQPDANGNIIIQNANFRGVVIGSTIGEANVAANLGAGQGIYASKADTTLRFKSLTEGFGINLSSSSTEINIAGDSTEFATLTALQDSSAAIRADIPAAGTDDQTLSSAIEGVASAKINIEDGNGIIFTPSGGGIEFDVPNDSTITFIVNDVDTQLSQEEVEDFAFDPARHGTGTQTLITVTYDDVSNNVDYVVNDDLSLYDNTTSDFVNGTELADSTAAVRAAFPAGDNLGNHTATQNLRMSGYYISADGDNEGILLDNSGNVTLSDNFVVSGTAQFEAFTDIKTNLFYVSSPNSGGVSDYNTGLNVRNVGTLNNTGDALSLHLRSGSSDVRMAIQDVSAGVTREILEVDYTGTRTIRLGDDFQALNLNAPTSATISTGSMVIDSLVESSASRFVMYDPATHQITSMDTTGLFGDTNLFTDDQTLNAPRSHLLNNQSFEMAGTNAFMTIVDDAVATNAYTAMGASADNYWAIFGGTTGHQFYVNSAQEFYIFNGGVALSPRTTAARPATPGEGVLGYNSDDNKVEYYNGTAWVQLEASDGTGTDDQTVDSLLLSGTTLILALEDDNEAPYTVDLSSLQTTDTHIGNQDKQLTGPRSLDLDANSLIINDALSGVTLDMAPSGVLTGYAHLYGGAGNGIEADENGVTIKLPSAADSLLIDTLRAASGPYFLAWDPTSKAVTAMDTTGFGGGGGGGTDDQTLSFTSPNLSIEDGNSVDLSALDTLNALSMGGNISLNSGYLSGDGDDEGITVDASGNVTASGDITVNGNDISGNAGVTNLNLAAGLNVTESGNFGRITATGTLNGILTVQSIDSTTNTGGIFDFKANTNIAVDPAFESMRWQIRRDASGYGVFDVQRRNQSFTFTGNILKYTTTAGLTIYSAANQTATTTSEALRVETGGDVLIYNDIEMGSGGPIITSGSGTPEGSVTAPVGSMYLRTDGGSGTTQYIKESGTGNTGWVAK